MQSIGRRCGWTWSVKTCERRGIEQPSSMPQALPNKGAANVRLSRQGTGAPTLETHSCARDWSMRYIHPHGRSPRDQSDWTGLLYFDPGPQTMMTNLTVPYSG